MSKFKTDGFRLSRDFLKREIFSDCLIEKERGGITVICVINGLIEKCHFSEYSYKAFLFQEEVEEFIDDFIKRQEIKVM